MQGSSVRKLVDIIFKTKHPLDLITVTNWFWSDFLQVHRSTSNKMDLSPDIDPTEISRNYLINYPDYSNFILFGQSKDKGTQLEKLSGETLKLK